MSIVSHRESVTKYNSVQDVSFDAVTKASISLLYVFSINIVSNHLILRKNRQFHEKQLSS